MPVGPSSSQPFNGNPNFSTDNATVWKGNNDSNAAIISPFGSLYVFPNNPAAMNVKVDVAANPPQAGFAAPIFLNSAASPVTVSLTAPGSNSYYATIYWDVQTQAPGVVYGASGASPTPILPDKIWQIPLALVLIASTDTTIQPTAIADIRSWCASGPIYSYNPAASSPLNIECNNASAVGAFVSFSSSTTINFKNLRIGVPVFLWIVNTGGGTPTATLTAKVPSGSSYSLIGKTDGGGAAGLGAVTLGTSGGANFYASGMTGIESGTPVLRLGYQL